MNLTDLLSGSVISSIAGQTGTSEKDTQNVLANALPALVGAMAQNASTEDGANSLAKALDDHTSSKGLASLLQNVDTEDGAKILTKILGGETETVRNAVAKKSGASKVDTSKILAMAAPLLLAALGSQKKKTKTQSDGLGGLLTSLLGGGDGDEDDGSTLISLAGSLLGGSNKKSGKSDSGDILTSLAGGLLTSALGGSGKKSSKKSDSSDVLSSLAGSLLGSALGTSTSGKKTTSSGKKTTSSGKKTTSSAKKTAGGKKTTSAKKTTSSKKKSTAQNDDAAELLGSVQPACWAAKSKLHKKNGAEEANFRLFFARWGGTITHSSRSVHILPVDKTDSILYNRDGLLQKSPERRGSSCRYR